MEVADNDFARKLLADMAAVAAKFNRKAGIDTGLNLARFSDRANIGMAMVRRLVPQEGATLRDFLLAASRRFADLKRTVDSAERKPPSIARFEQVIRAMGQVILEAAQSQDCLFELSGAFRRGFDLLAERPKQPATVMSPADLLFTAKERTRIVKAIQAFYEIIVMCGHDCYAASSLLPDQPLPERIERIIAKHRPDRTRPISEKARQAMIADTYFAAAKEGLWSYDGSFFRYLKRYFGACNSENIDPETFLDETFSPFLDLPIGDLISSSAGQAMGLSIVAAMTTGDGTPETAAARVHDVGEEIRRSLLSDKLQESNARIPELRKQVGKLLSEASAQKGILESEEHKANVRAAKDPQAEEKKRLSLLQKVDDNIRRMEKALCELDTMERDNNAELDANAPRLDLDSFMPKPLKTNEDPKSYSKYRDKTLRRSKDEWIKVEKDGVTFSCPTRMGREIRPRSYTMPNASQIAFIDALLDRFESGEWYKPNDNKAVWKNTLFNRGDAKQFHDDKHIQLWEGEKGGMRGGIRLSAP